MNSIEQYITVQGSRGSIIVTSSGDETSSGLYAMKRLKERNWKAHYGFHGKDSGILTVQNPSSTDTPLEQGSNDMVHNYYLEKAKKSEQLQKDKEVMEDLISLYHAANKSGLMHNRPSQWSKAHGITKMQIVLYNEKQENLRVWPRSSMFTRRLIAADQASVFMAMMSVHISSGLVLHQKTSDHNRSELGIHDHSNEPSSSKLVPKVVPLAVVRLGINPMIQPEPDDLPKDNPELEIAVLRVILFSIHNDEWKSFQCHHQTALRMSMLVKNKRSQDGKDDKDNDKGSKSRSQSMKEQDYNEDKDQEHSSLNDKSNLTDLMKECHQ
ncbi:hypothetical protein Tco_0345654 [Tanacetum coccineum]